MIEVGGYWRDNAWRTQWVEEGRTLFKQFEGNSPKPAVEFGKKLKLRGITVVDVISVRRAFPPPLRSPRPDRPGILWCPYCVKWRAFEEAAIRKPEYTTPSLMRCTVCTISIRDAYVRTYNPELVIRIEVQQEMRDRARQAAKARKKTGKKGTETRGAFARRR